MKHYENLDLKNIVYLCPFEGIKKVETWKDVIGWEGLYQISNIGRAKSLKRLVERKINGNILIKERIMKQKKIVRKNKIYLAINLSDKKRTKSTEVHQLMAMAFLNHTPCGFKIVVDHVDDNSLNNNVFNLQLITNRKNVSKSKNGITGFTGVTKSGKKFESGIKFCHKKYYLGTYETSEEASRVYQLALSLIESNQSFSFLLKEKQVSKTGHYGIQEKQNKHSKRFSVRFSINGKNEHIGIYDSLEEAIIARDTKISLIQK